MFFSDRCEAGQKLAKLLEAFEKRKDTLVIGLPRGGIPVAYEIAKALDLPLDIVCPRKIGAPSNPEFAIGAITETGEGLLDYEIIGRLDIGDSYLKEHIQKESEIAAQRLRDYRIGLPKRELKGKTVIVVDDGLATGATMKAAIASLKKEGVEAIVVAVPVAPLETAREIEAEVEQIVVLDTPSFFQAVGQFYESFPQTDDEEVIDLLKKANHL